MTLGGTFGAGSSGVATDTLGRFELGRVYQGEALALLREIPSDSVDLVLADPPYSSGGLMRSDRSQDPLKKYEQDGVQLSRLSFSGDNRDGRSFCYWSALWLSECLRVLKEGAYCAIFSDWRQLPNATDAFQAGGLVWRGLVAWDKGEGARAPHKGYFRHQAEYVVWGTRGALGPATHAGPFPGVFRFNVRQDDKHHATGKPTELLRELVKVVPRGAVVLDPFAGSGTTLVACELEGRRGVGFDVEPVNVHISNERIAGARSGLGGRAALEGQAPLFVESIGKAPIRRAAEWLEEKRRAAAAGDASRVAPEDEERRYHGEAVCRDCDGIDAGSLPYTPHSEHVSSGVKGRKEA